MPPDPPPPTRAKTRQELAAEYGWHRNTLQKRLEQVGIQLPRGSVCPKDQERIYQALGTPTNKNS